MMISVLICAVLLHLGSALPATVRPMDNNVQPCTADTSGWVRSGNHLRERGDCQQGYICHGNEIKPFRDPCPDDTYFSVHTGVCSRPNAYDYIFSSFSCSAEEDDPNLDFEQLKEKRDRLCKPLVILDDTSDELYVGDPDNCRQWYKCSLARNDDWLQICPPGYRFQEGEEGPCKRDTHGCGLRRR